MYCHIQKIKKKKPNQYGASKELKVTTTTYKDQLGKTETIYGYSRSLERFERPILDAYKISIHESYRENGKVKKKQWVICTMSYYDIVDYSLWDCAGFRIRDKAEEIGLSEDELYKIIYKKLDPLTKRIEIEFFNTEEYKTKQKHDEIIKKYNSDKVAFEKKYGIWGNGEYDKCYDVFGTLRNPPRLKTLEDILHRSESSYQQNKQSNYSNSNDYDYSSYFKTSSSNYTDDEKGMLKKIYREASKKFHPDVSGDDGSIMKLLTKLKEQWGI